jgi:hypothetical protein
MVLRIALNGYLEVMSVLLMRSMRDAKQNFEDCLSRMWQPFQASKSKSKVTFIMS